MAINVTIPVDGTPVAAAAASAGIRANWQDIETRLDTLESGGGGGVGPAGPQGPAGPAGPQGPVGPAGPSGGGAAALDVETVQAASTPTALSTSSLRSVSIVAAPGAGSVIWTPAVGSEKYIRNSTSATIYLAPPTGGTINGATDSWPIIPNTTGLFYSTASGVVHTCP